MSVEGSIATTVLFHDRDGTTSLKVVDLSSSDSYSSGKVAIVTGTMGTSNVTINCQPTTYRDASGEFVNFTTVRSIAFSATRLAQAKDGLTSTRLLESEGQVSVTRFVSAGGFGQGPSIELDPQYTSGTASYSVVIYGD